MPDQRAWNNFVMKCEPADFDVGDSRRSAAIAAMYMGVANNGGLNHFLTACHELGGDEVIDALTEVGAVTAARQLRTVVEGLGVPLPSTSQEARWDLMDKHWKEALDVHDVLSTEADDELMEVLERHVRENEAFYLSLGVAESPLRGRRRSGLDALLGAITSVLKVRG